MMKPNEKILNLNDYLDQRPKESITAFFAKKLNATISKRVFAFFIDIFIINFINFVIFSAYSAFLNGFLFSLPGKKIAYMSKNLISIEPLVGLTILYGYFLFCYYVTHGKSLGKKIMKLSVVSDSYLTGNMLHKSPELKEAFLRASGYVICYLSAGILFFMPFFRKDKRGIQDILSKTSVLEDKQLYEYFISQEKKDEQIVYLNLESLEDKTKTAA